MTNSEIPEDVIPDEKWRLIVSITMQKENTEHGQQAIHLCTIPGGEMTHHQVGFAMETFSRFLAIINVLAYSQEGEAELAAKYAQAVAAGMINEDGSYTVNNPVPTERSNEDPFANAGPASEPTAQEIAEKEKAAEHFLKKGLH